MSGSAWSVKGHGHCQSLPFFLLLSHGSTSRDNDLFGLVQEEEPRCIETYTATLEVGDCLHDKVYTTVCLLPFDLTGDISNEPE